MIPVKYSSCVLAFLGLALIPAAALSMEQAASAESCMVATAHPSATMVGVSILDQGGNAADAGIAVALALAVCEPYSSGIGGGGFVVAFDAATGETTALDARESAPASSTREMYQIDGKADAQMSRFGPLSVGVPGLVQGLWELHQKQGSLPWPQLVQPAIDLASQGVVVSPMLRERIKSYAHRFNRAAKEIFLPQGEVPALGSLLIQKDLASTLRDIAEKGPKEGFYSGPTARSMAETASKDGRGLTTKDLENYRPRWRQPISGAYRGLEVVSMPPPSSGGVVLVQMLNILEGFDLGGMGYGSAAATHCLTEAMKFAYADRSLYLGDSDFVPVPLERLLSAARVDSLAALIGPEAAYPLENIQGAGLIDTESNETTHFSIVDPAGNAVAATLTINLSFGSGLVAPGTGIMLNDEMDDFVAAPGQPNAFGLVGGEANSIAPNKRPLSSMTPTIVLKDGKVFMVTGAPGGSKIITTTLQTIINVVDHKMDALQAVTVPRVHHQWFPAKLYYEHFGLSPDTMVQLEKMGHTLQSRSQMCNAQVIVVNPEDGRLYGASDRRGMGTAAGF